MSGDDYDWDAVCDCGPGDDGYHGAWPGPVEFALLTLLLFCVLGGTALVLATVLS